MPKGVEHTGQEIDRMDRVAPRNSVMPKGVEHFAQFAGVLSSLQPRNSVMPKGVEHMPVGLEAPSPVVRETP